MHLWPWLSYRVKISTWQKVRKHGKEKEKNITLNFTKQLEDFHAENRKILHKKMREGLYNWRKCLCPCIKRLYCLVEIVAKLIKVFLNFPCRNWKANPISYRNPRDPEYTKQSWKTEYTKQSWKTRMCWEDFHFYILKLTPELH